MDSGKTSRSRVVVTLLFNASLQIFVSTLLGFVMLVPMQPWGKGIKESLPDMHSMLAVHIDWYMLAFMEFAVAFLFHMYPPLESKFVARLFMYGGWINPLAYFFRGFGINAFVLDIKGAGLAQNLASLFCLSSSVSVLVAWILLLSSFYSKIVVVNSKND
jgi:hypothetical protein